MGEKMMMNEMREPTAAGGGLNKGHTGDPIENAIDIQAPDHRTGTLMECAHVEERLGASGKDWDLITRALLHDGTHYYDQLSIRLKTGQTVDCYSRIDSFCPPVLSSKDKLTEGWGLCGP